MNKKEEKNEKYQLMLSVVKSDDFYDNALYKFKEIYISGLGTAYMKTVYADKERKEEITNILIDYVNYLHKKNKIKDVDKQLNSLYVDCFSLFANKAFNKDMYPDASLEKYLNEAPEITVEMKELLVSDFPEILLNINQLRKREIRGIGKYYYSESELIDYFSHASIAKLIENTFLERFNEHFEKNRNIRSEENQKFYLGSFTTKLSDTFCEFPKAVKVLKTISLTLTNSLAELLLQEDDKEKFNEEFKKLIKFWKNTANTYPKEDLVTGNISKIFKRYIEGFSTLEIEEFLKEINKGLYSNENISKLKNLIDNHKPDYKGDLLIKKNAIEDCGSEIVYKRKIKIKGEYFLDIIKNVNLADKVSGEIYVERITNVIKDEHIRREHFCIINIETKTPLELEANQIIDIINSIMDKESAITEQMSEQVIRTLELQNKILQSDNENESRARKKL